MVASLAPNRYSMGRLNTSPVTVRRIPTATIITKALPIMDSASDVLPRPRSMEHNGAPPMPNRFANAMTMDMMGRHNPRPVSDKVACSGIMPMYIRSTILYSTLISWARVMGRASFRIFFMTLPFEKSLVSLIQSPFPPGMACRRSRCPVIAPGLPADRCLLIPLPAPPWSTRPRDAPS